MRFRPCIDIHNGKVKQIVGGSLKDDGNQAVENFVSDMDAADYARLYQKYNLSGGHAILLNPAGSEFYDADVRQAKSALAAYPGGLQLGGGIHQGNAEEFLDAGASHVIVTSYVFHDGIIQWDRLKSLTEQIGKEHLVLDVSCKPRDGKYYIVTNRWQTFTEQPVDEELLSKLSSYCDEFLVHGVKVEGTGCGIDCDLVKILANHTTCPVTYAGGIGSYEDLEELKKLTSGMMDYTIGSALDLFGGDLKFNEIVTRFNNL